MSSSYGGTSGNGAASQNVVAQAVQLHQMGRLAEAERLYDAVLRQDPRNFAALHMLGVVRLTQGDPKAAISLIGKALEIDPRSPEATANYGNALLHARRFKDAIAHFEKAVALGVRHAEVLTNLGCALLEMRRPADALASFDKALAMNPALVPALNNKAAALLALGQAGAALAASDKACAAAPPSPETLNTRGTILTALGRNSEALAVFDRALAANPGAASVLNNRATALRLLGRHDEAMDACEKAIGLAPQAAEAWVTRGNVLRDRERYRQALESYEQALALNPNLAEALNSRSAVLNELEEYERAMQSASGALALRPGLAEAFNNRGAALMNLKRLDEAQADFDAALRLAPEYAEAVLNKSLCLLLRGDFAQGLELYEWRKRIPRPIDLRDYPQAPWTGVEDISGKHLFLYAQQDMGDAIQFCRYLAGAADKGARVTLAVQPGLHRLLRRAFPQIELLEQQARPESFDYHNTLASMPWAFWRNARAIWAPDSYLAAEPEVSRSWSSRIGSKGFKIGIAWQGNPTGAIDKGRSFPLSLLAPIARMDTVRLISLQKNYGTEQLHDLPDGMAVETLGEAFDARPDAFIDTAAVIQSLDLVITSDTAIAHLAGALGKPVWVALKHVPDWRWQIEGARCPWYPSMRLFRQEKPGEWPLVFAAIKAALAERV